MKKSEKWKTIFKSKSLIYIVIAFAPVAINLGLVFTDIIYEKTGNTLTAKGLNNAEWLGFWKQYLAIAISFVGLCVAYVSSNTDRKHKLQEEQAQQYLEGVRQEENVLVDVTQGFNTSIVYKALLQQSKSANIYDGRMVMTNARTNMDQMHIKFEILTELCDVLGIIVEKEAEILDGDIEKLIEERQTARKEKNFARADEIRDELAAMGIILKDTREGVTWKRV